VDCGGRWGGYLLGCSNFLFETKAKQVFGTWLLRASLALEDFFGTFLKVHKIENFLTPILEFALFLC
jgi:hypothetical protein